MTHERGKAPKALWVAGLALSALTAGGQALAADRLIYGVNRYAEVYEINLTQATERKLGPLSVGTEAADQDPQTGNVYYYEWRNSGDELSSWNPQNGTNTRVRLYVPAPGLFAKRMAFAPDGTLYMMDSQERLYTLDKTNGNRLLRGTVTGLVTGDQDGVGDMAFAPDGTLYLVTYGNLYRVDVATLTSTLLYENLLDPAVQIWTGLGWCDGLLYASRVPLAINGFNPGVSSIVPETGEMQTVFDSPTWFLNDLTSCVDPVVPTPPADPTNLTAAAVSGSRIDLLWQDASSNEAGFAIERQSGGSAFVEVARVGANIASWSDNGLTPDTAYGYRVRAFNGSLYSGYTNEAAATTPGLAPPAAPAALTATAASASRVNLAWQDRATDEGGFEIERRTGPAAYALLATLSANATSYADDAVASGTAYTYRVRAFNMAGNSEWSNEASAATPVVNQAPTATITAPAPGASFLLGATVAYAGDATDPEDGVVAASGFTWYVRRLGKTNQLLATGVKSGSVIVTARATYVLQLVVRDSGGLTGTREVQFTVR